MMRIGLVFLFGLFSCALIGQNAIANFELDCSLIDSTGTFQNIATPSFPGCECGLEGEAFNVGGAPFLTVDTAVSSILGSDFAVSFYFQPLVSTNVMELLSVGNNCSSDSLLRVYYLDDMKEVVFEASQTILESVSLSGIVSSSKCWQHVVISRNANTFTLYLNGELADEVIFGSDIVLDITEPFKIGHGPCVGVISNKFDGLIDQVEFFDEHIQAFRARELYIPNDEIISSDTTIFEGDIITLEATPNCTNDISWFPATGISNTTDFITDLEGIESTTYIARFDGQFCVATDTIDIFVIDPDEVECSSLLLPNVFTPNGDGLNDDFGILNGFIVEDLKSFQIFDRWGEIVYSSEDKNERWDGSFKNKAVNSNILLYKVVYTCSGTEYVKTGNISILR